jgi:hypothetical protein
MDFIDTECVVKNEQRLLSRMLRNHIASGTEVIKVGDCNQLEESF